MSNHTNGIPEGFHTLTPYLILKDASKAIQFYKEAFGAKEVETSPSADGRIMNAVLKIGNSLMMLSDEFPEFENGVSNPHSLKGTTAMFHLYVEDADAAFDKAVKAGATIKMPIDDMFWGDRYGQLQDPYGHLWSIATPIKNFKPAQKNSWSGDCCKSSSSCCG